MDDIINIKDKTVTFHKKTEKIVTLCQARNASIQHQ